MSQMTTYIPLTDKLRDYLSGRCQLSALEEWLVENLDSLLMSSSQEDVARTNQLDVLFIERSEGLCDENRIRSYIFTELHPSIHQLGFSQPATSNVTLVDNRDADRPLSVRSMTISAQFQLSGEHR